MVSRLKGIETWRCGFFGTVPCQKLWIWFPVWRELKQKSTLQPARSPLLPLDMVSRLKGIETPSPTTSCMWHLSSFGYGFPFEGNWNLASLDASLASLDALDMVSRLKGIETRFKTLLKGGIVTLDMLSRLKGIETQLLFRLPGWIHPLWICFPVWRELKQKTPPLPTKINFWLWICFPVWRELKLTLTVMLVAFTLDMLSRLKGIETYRSLQVPWSLTFFGYGFPFEGNWNLQTRGWVSDRDVIPLDMLSRLKGIETKKSNIFFLGKRKSLDMLSRLKGIETWRTSLVLDLLGNSLDMLSRLKGIETRYWRENDCNLSLYFGYAFPFEGNWNISPSFVWPFFVALWIWFPVWRELKHQCAAQCCS